jgi:hypothetical protein
MTFSDLGIQFHAHGIGDVLQANRLFVPANQRPYAWEDDQVEQLFQDLGAAILEDNKAYFLGTIVLANSEEGQLLVADGQQRLATVTILIAAIRDYLASTGAPNEKAAATKYEQQYLLEFDEHHNDFEPKLTLNIEDRDFFEKYILAAPDTSQRIMVEPKGSSHNRLTVAAKVAQKQVQSIIGGLSRADGAKRLFTWIDFLRNKAMLIVIRVPKYLDAYKMFETLNDRGLRASQIDLLKNYIFSEASASFQSEVQPRWASMVGIIESIGNDELLLTYVRHFWIMRHGPTIEDDLAEDFREEVKGRSAAREIVLQLEEEANDYVALLTPLEHPRIAELGRESRAAISAMTTILRVVQIRPLLLAIIRKFSVAEARLALESCLSWSVRFMIAGGGGGGVLDKRYGELAYAVFKKEVTTASQLSERMRAYVPTDVEFRDAFRNAQISKTVVARYFLHSFESFRRGEARPQLGYFEMPETSMNLEHILPVKPQDGWNISADDAQSYYKRVGNMALLSAKLNSKIGSSVFSEKKVIFGASTFLTTQEIADCSEWTIREIQDRQNGFAESAAAVWPL